MLRFQCNARLEYRSEVRLVEWVLFNLFASFNIFLLRGSAQNTPGCLVEINQLSHEELLAILDNKAGEF